MNYIEGGRAHDSIPHWPIHELKTLLDRILDRIRDKGLAVDYSC